MRGSLVERSWLTRYAFAVAAAGVAAAFHWAIFPVTQGHIPFLLFLPAIILASALAGRGPGALVLVAGFVNASIQLAPAGTVVVYSTADRVALLAYVLTSVFLVFVGHLLRTTAKREFDDLRELHELSNAVATTADLREQLRLILTTLARMHSATKGLVSLFEPRTNTLSVAASLDFSPAALERLRFVSGGEGACGTACAERRRVVVEDVTKDACFAPFRDLAAQEGIRAVHSTPLLSRTGEILGAISVHLARPRKPTKREISLADICAGKAAVAIQRAAAEESARCVEERFRTVLEASAVPFVILEPVRAASGSISDFRWAFANAAAARALGRERDDLIGARIREVLPGTWDEPGLLEMYASVLEGQTPRQRELRSESNGLVGWFQIVASPLDDKVAVWFADITERKRQEEKLQDADRRKDEFLATLAHELRNPLAPIRQAATIAANDRATEAQRRWGYSVIQRQVEHMSLLLDDLLDVSRITRGTLSLRKQQVDVHTIVSAAVETARPLIDSRHHQLVTTIAEGLSISGDPLRLSQIFANLLTNAAKYTPPAGTIRFTAEAENRTVVVRVEDTGIGFREEDARRLFQMFSQLKAPHEHAPGGLGIGLALTKGLVEMHSGSIEATSAGPGQGSTFTVRLPIGEVAQVPAARARDAREPNLIVSRRVLIADDNADAAESLAILLRMEGHHVIVASDGEEAVRSFVEHRPDVALLDIGMPQMSGYEVARHIRAHRDGSAVLLIALTGWGQEKDRLRSQEAGFDHHLTKPIEPEALSRLMRGSLRLAAGG